MKEMILKIRAMPKKRLKKYKKGTFSKAYEVSVDDFKHYYCVDCYHRFSSLIQFILKDRGEL